MQEIPYQVVRSNRKSIALVIDSDANLIVRAPYRAKESDIAGFVEKKRNWIASKQRQISGCAAKYSPLSLKNGEGLPYLGNIYIIKRDAVPSIRLSGANILLPAGCTKDDVIAWMQGEAAGILAERVPLYAGRMEVRYSSVKLSGAKTRWGSCSAKDKLRFAWRLAMCPLPVIDYVVVHELCHVAHKNHGAVFWASVRAAFPNYKQQRDWLKANGKIMEIL